MSEPTLQPPKAVRPMASVAPSKAGLISFLLALAAMLLCAWESFLLVHDRGISPGAAKGIPLYLLAAVASGVGLGLALAGTKDKRPQVMPPLLGLALNGPVLVLNGVILLILAFVVSGLAP